MIIEFLIWTFILYWIHRLIHIFPILSGYHNDHHIVIIKSDPVWHWNNLLLYNDTYKSTIDLWTTEVVPTIIISYVLGAWWLCVFYYLWAAFIQERIEHNRDFDLPILASGKWHLVHHHSIHHNFGFLLPMWDILFGTYQRK